MAVQRQLDSAKAISAKAVSEQEQEVVEPTLEEVPTPPPEPTPEVNEELEKLEHRLRTVQGMWDADV